MSAFFDARRGGPAGASSPGPSGGLIGRWELRRSLGRLRCLHGWKRVERVHDHAERNAVTLANLLDRLELRDRAVGASSEVKVGEHCSRAWVESKCFADGQSLVEFRTVCTDGDHPLLPSCVAVFSSSGDKPRVITRLVFARTLCHSRSANASMSGASSHGVSHERSTNGSQLKIAEMLRLVSALCR